MRERQMKFLILLIISCISIELIGQSVNIQVEKDKDSILIGEKINLKLIVNISGEQLITLPEISESFNDTIELLKYSDVDTIINGDELSYIQQITITSFDSGTHMLPVFPVIRQIGDRIDTLESATYKVFVNNVKIDPENSIKDIKGTLKAPITIVEILFYLLLLIIIGVVGYFVYRMILKMKKTEKKVQIFSKPQEPCHIIALRNLEKLKNEKLWQQGRYKQYHTELTTILREYLEKRYAIKALEQTSEEIFQSLIYSGFNDNELMDKLKKILVLADYVKFAKAQPLPDENDGAMLNAVAFINETKRIEQETALKEEQKTEE